VFGHPPKFIWLRVGNVQRVDHDSSEFEHEIIPVSSIANWIKCWIARLRRVVISSLDNADAYQMNSEGGRTQ